MKTTILAFTLILMGFNANSQSKKKKSKVSHIAAQAKTPLSYHTMNIDGLELFYREAGDKNKPTILLLHGFPSSSAMYGDLMADLASNYHVIAPDYPGFGQSSTPSIEAYDYTFDNLATLMDTFIDRLALKKVSLYMQDYGGPVGFRIATRRPELIQSLIIQNTNAYVEGFGDVSAPLVAYIQDPNPETEKGARGFLSFGSTKWQYTDGAEDVTKISPDSYILDQAYLDREGNDLIQLALFRNYGTNISKYDEWHTYFKDYQPKTLIIWGKNDKIFTAPGAEAFKKDLPKAELHFLNGGHFLLAEHHKAAAGLIDTFLSKK